MLVVHGTTRRTPCHFFRLWTPAPPGPNTCYPARTTFLGRTSRRGTRLRAEYFLRGKGDARRTTGRWRKVACCPGLDRDAAPASPVCQETPGLRAFLRYP